MAHTVSDTRDIDVKINHSLKSSTLDDQFHTLSDMRVVQACKRPLKKKGGVNIKRFSALTESINEKIGTHAKTVRTSVEPMTETEIELLEALPTQYSTARKPKKAKRQLTKPLKVIKMHKIVRIENPEDTEWF